MGNYVVYDHISPSGKHYIGQTCQKPEKRWGKNGKHYLGKNKYGEWVQPYIANAILKYGWDNFEHKILFDNLTLQEANMIEEDLVYYYKKIGKSYNVRNGGDNHSGIKKSEEAKKRFRDSCTFNRPVNQYTKEGVFVATYPFMQDAAKAIRCSIGTLWAACRSNKRTAKGYVWRYADENSMEYDDTVYNSKAIEAFSLDNKFIGEYKSMSEASRKIGVSKHSIIAVCKGRKHSVKGYIFKYK